jgi:hypothetical protein
MMQKSTSSHPFRRRVGPGLLPLGLLLSTLLQPVLAQPVLEQPHRPTARLQPQSLALNHTQAGNAIAINGSVLPIPWVQVDERIAIADYALTDHFGGTLLNTEDAQTQPVLWFSEPDQTPIPLTVWLDSGYRFLDITDLSVAQGWAITPQGNTLQITQPPTQLQAIRHELHPWGERLVVNLTGATLTQLSEGVGEFTLTLNATADGPIINLLPEDFSTPGIPALTLTPQPDRTLLTAQINRQTRPLLTTLANPHRLVIDIRADFLQPLNILWAPGLRWRQQYISAAGKPFPVYWLEVDPHQSADNLRPIWTDPVTATGITPLQTMAQRWQAAAAINAGFFNRNNQYPLGAIRFNQDWISGPILSRGVIGWDGSGNAMMRRLFLKQTLTTAAGETFPIQTINSGFVQAGISLYTPAWGADYRPLLGTETVVTVGADAVVSQQLTATDPAQPIPIPADGYVLALRSFATAAAKLAPGTLITLQSELLPPELEPFPHIVGGGPLLLQNASLVLNAAAEQFSNAFATQAAPRSAIGINADGELLLVAVHHSPTGLGPTLNELAQIMAQLGSTDALNLDGGSSASLYLGGRLLNRNPRTAARVNNGIGLFLDPNETSPGDL